MNEPLQTILDPRGPGARGLLELGTILTYATLIPALLTIVALLYAIFHRRAAGAPKGRRRRDLVAILVAGGLIPTGILFYLFLENVRIGAAVAEAPSEPMFTVDVIGHQFWWEIHYPDQDIVAANELHIPTGVPIRVRTTSADVIHSFWVPQLHGKIDMTPGHTTELWLQADEPGVFRGQCTEFCGIQHALMAFLVVAQAPDVFERWAEQHRQPAEAPTEPLLERGLAVYHEGGCAHCHPIRGVVPESATGTVGPDLTHLANRRTLGAVALANNRGNLAGWVLDPQSLKPGVRMPPVTLPPDDLHALVAFLESLR